MKHSVPDGRTRRAIANRESILEAANEIFLTKGYFDNTMMDISQKAGVGYGTLYTHFNGKEDILKHLIDEVASDFDQIVSVPYHPKSANEVEQRISQELEYLLNLAVKHRPILKVSYQAMGISQDIKDHWNQIFKKHIHKAMHDYSYSFSKGLTKAELDPKIVAKSIVFLAKEFFWDVVLEKENSIENVSKNIAALFIFGAYR